MEGTGRSLSGIPDTIDQLSTPGKAPVVGQTVDGLIVNRKEPKRSPDKQADNYKIEKVDTGERTTGLESPGNGSVYINTGNLIVDASDEAASDRTEAAKQRQCSRDDVNSSGTSGNDWQKIFNNCPTYSKKDLRKMEFQLCKKLLSLEIINQAEHWESVSTNDTSCDREKMLLDVTRECQELFEALEGTDCPANIKRYVKLLWVQFGLYHLDECLKSGSPNYQLSFMTTIKDITEYLGFLHAVAKNAGRVGKVIPESRHLQLFCYYKAADAGCENAKRLLIKEMLFCRIIGDKKDVLEYQLFSLREALTLMSTLPRRKVSAENKALPDYEQIIYWLMEVIDKEDVNTRDKLANKLIMDERPEVKALVPMLFFEKSIGVVDPERALEFINELSKIPVLKAIHDYWLCRYHFSDGKENVEGFSKKLGGLMVDMMPSAFDICLDYFLDPECKEKYSKGQFNIVYRLINSSCFLLPRDLAHRMVMCSYVLDEMDGFRKDRDVSKAKKKAKIVSIIYGHPDVVADKLYDESKYFFTIDNWRKSGSEEMMSPSKAFLNTMNEFVFSRDPVIGIFRDAFQVIMNRPFSLIQIDDAFKQDSIKTVYWSIVLSFLPTENQGFSDLVNLFLRKSDGGIGFLPFVHGLSLAEFIRKSYRYHAFSDESKDHPLFIPATLELFDLSKKDCKEFLQSLSVIKMLRGYSRQEIWGEQKIKDVSEYELPADYMVVKKVLSEDSRLLLKLAVQESYPLGDSYKYKQLVLLLERINVNNDLAFHVDLFEFLIGFINESKFCLGQERIVTLFDGCLKIAYRIKMIMAGVLEKQCQELSSWHEGLAVTMKHSIEMGRLSNVLESLERLKADLYESDQVNEYNIDSEKCLLDYPDHVTVQSLYGESMQTPQQAGKAFGESSKVTGLPTESELLFDHFKSFTEHHLLSQLRRIDSDEKFMEQVEKIAGSLPDDSIDNLALAEISLARFKHPKPEYCNSISIIASGLQRYFRGNINLEFNMILNLLESMRNNLNRPPRNTYTGIIRTELQYYRLLADMALRGGKVLARFFEESKVGFLSQVSIAISGNSFQMTKELVKRTTDNCDISRLFRASLPIFKNTGFAKDAMVGAVFNQMAEDDEATSDVADLAECMRLSVEGGCTEQVFKSISEHRQMPEIQSELLWMGYESGVLLADEYLNQVVKFDKESKEYYFHSLLIAERADQQVFMDLQNNKKLNLFKRPQLEIIGLKLVEVGRIKDACWLSEKYKLDYLGMMLAWCDDENIIITPGVLIPEAETGRNQAQCRLVDWVLHQKQDVLKDKALANKNEQTVAKKSSGAASVQSCRVLSAEYLAIRDSLIDVQCCFYIHLPCIWSDSQRILYQGVALCTGIGGHQDEVEGIEKIKEALTSDDPEVPFILYWLQTASLVEKEYFPNKDLLMEFARRMPDSPGRLLTGLIVNIGELAVRQVVSKMNEMAGQKEEEWEMLKAQSRSIQQWLYHWCEQIKLEGMSPAEKLIYHFKLEAENEWPVQNLNRLQDMFTRLSESHLKSDFFQTELILYVKRLIWLSETHKNFAMFLSNSIESRSRHRLLINEGEGKGLVWNSQVFERDKMLTLFRAISKKQRRKMLESLVAEISCREKRPDKYGSMKVDQNRMPGKLVKELVKEVKDKNHGFTEAKLAHHIRNVSQETGKKKYKYSELLQYFCFVDSSGLNMESIQAFRKVIRDMASDSLKGKIDFGNETEVLSTIAICILA
ncbi:hypothetical protein [Endozoicomonas sp.]|uniref:hypothetical protein n=1 Tax=Endozoicomonas sp. TaxID=1892382 RepID=UPI00383B6581